MRLTVSVDFAFSRGEKVWCVLPLKECPHVSSPYMSCMACGKCGKCSEGTFSHLIPRPTLKTMGPFVVDYGYIFGSIYVPSEAGKGKGSGFDLPSYHFSNLEEILGEEPSEANGWKNQSGIWQCFYCGLPENVLSSSELEAQELKRLLERTNICGQILGHSNLGVHVKEALEGVPA